MNASIAVWVAGLFSCVAHGSFTVPMKGESANKVDIDPFVFQTYKTAMSLFTSLILLLVIYLFDDGIIELSLCLGICSGFLWVTGGTCGILAVRTIGIAQAVGIWSCVLILTSFFWSTLVFHDDKINSILLAGLSLLFIIVSIVGMSVASNSDKEHTDEIIPEDNEEAVEETDCLDDEDISINSTENNKSSMQQPLLDSNENGLHNEDNDRRAIENDVYTVCCGKFTIQKTRLFGIMGAVMNGLLSGASLVPVELVSNPEQKGLHYVISFAFGASICCIFFWILRFLFILSIETSSSISITDAINKSYKELPSFHLKEMLIPGCTSGLLWSTGNIGNILAVSYLGDFVGLSLTQLSLIVNGLWGIFYYKEIREKHKIQLWFISAGLLSLSVFILSQLDGLQIKLHPAGSTSSTDKVGSVPPLSDM